LNILRQMKEKLNILWNLLLGVNNNNNNNNNNNANLEENLQPIEEVKTANTSEIDSIENFHHNFDDLIYKIKLGISGLNNPNQDMYFMDWVDTFSTANRSQLLLLTSFTVINWVLVAGSIKGYRIDLSTSLFSELENFNLISELDKLAFKKAIWARNLSFTTDQLNMYGEVFKVRSLRRLYRSEILPNDSSINWRQPLIVDEMPISDTMKLLLEDSIEWAHSFRIRHHLAPEAFNDLCRMHFNYNLQECAIAFEHLANSEASKLVIRTTLLPVNCYLQYKGLAPIPLI